MSEGPPAKKESGGRRVLFGCLLGCGGLIGLAAILGIAGCVSFYVWISARGEVDREASILTGGEEAYLSVYVAQDDPGVMSTIEHLLDRLEGVQQETNPFPLLGPLQQWSRSKRERDLRRLLPLHLEIATVPAAEPGGKEGLLGEATFSGQYRQFQLMYWMMTWTLGRGDAARTERVGPHSMTVVEPRDSRPFAAAFVENRLCFAAPPELLRDRLERLGSPASPASPAEQSAARRRREALAASADTGEAWAFVDRDSGLAGEWLGNLRDASGGAPPELRDLLESIASAAVALDLVTDDQLAFTLAIDLDPERAVSAEDAATIAALIAAKIEQWQPSIACAVRPAGRRDGALVFEGEITGLRAAVDAQFDEIEAKLERQRTGRRRR